MNDGAWFKTYYKIVDWGWFKEPRTLQVFIFLIARASIVPTEFMGITVDRGQVVTSYPGIAEGTGCSIQEARTAISHLKSTGEITVKVYQKFSLITLLNYNKYQTRQQGKQQAANSQPTGNQQAANTIIRNKEYKKIKNIGASPPSPSAGETGDGKEEKLPPPAERFNRSLEGYLPEDWERENVPPNMWNYFESLDEWKAWVNR